MTLQGWFWAALARWFDARDLSGVAETCLRHAAATEGRVALDSAWRIGKRLLDQDRSLEAARILQALIERDPGHVRGWCALGPARRRLAEMEAARSAFERALELDPGFAPARNNLGEWLLMKGDSEAALAEFDRAIADSPELLEAANNRVAALYDLGRLDEAEAAARRALERHPDSPALHTNLGNVLLLSAQARGAVKSFRRAIELDPACVEPRFALSMLLGETAHLGDAIEWIEHEIAVKGENAQRLATLALTQQARGDLPAAEATCRRVVAMSPDNIASLVTLAGCLSARGDHRGALALYEQALRIRPQMPNIRTNIAFVATHIPDMAPEEVFDLHRQWALHHEEPLADRRYRHEPGSDPEKKLRIGYVSGDLGYHPVGFLIRDVLPHHDRERHEIHMFSMMRADDDITADIRRRCDVWHDVLFDSDEEVAHRVHEAGVDILVDLSGHTAYNRLVSFALRPAPVQATWIGYFHSTGLNAIDYFITDPHTSPPERGQLFSETPVRMPHSRFCYAPPAYAPAPAPPPVLERGYVTFGCFNRQEKLTDEVIALWADLLRRMPDARLLLKAGSLDNETVADGLRARFSAHGADPERIELRGRSSHAEMFAEYGDVDIALDPFPFNGGMTTLEALWMGVPVVTLTGQGVVSRQSFSVLANIGHADELAFGDADAWIEGVIALARDGDRLADLRKRLRPLMASSPICDPARFTRDLETLYRQMWCSWCATSRKHPSHFPLLPV